MVIVHLTASRFFGGPERQMLELARALSPAYCTAFVSFSESGYCDDFLTEVRRNGFQGIGLANDTPYFRAAFEELVELLDQLKAEVICCHGYKADVFGWLAARKLGIPAVAVSRGWTGENLRVRVYEALDRRVLRWMDHVICVSAGQARKVWDAGVKNLSVIHNAVREDRFAQATLAAREQLRGLFRRPIRHIVGAAGRLSPEKGFDILVKAAALVAHEDPAVGFVLFGEGSLHEELSRRLAALGLQDRFFLPGFRRDLDAVIPAFDLLVVPSYTEGLPNVILEAFAAEVPVVATAVGGIPELVDDGTSGYLVPAGDPAALARRIGDALTCEDRRRAMGQAGRDQVTAHFTFAAQAQKYQELFGRWLPTDRGNRGNRRMSRQATAAEV